MLSCCPSTSDQETNGDHFPARLIVAEEVLDEPLGAFSGRLRKTVSGGYLTSQSEPMREFTFVRTGMLGINVKRTRFEILDIRQNSCIALRSRELVDEYQLKIKDNVIAVNGKRDTPLAMMKLVADTPEGAEVTLTIERPTDCVQPPVSQVEILEDTSASAPVKVPTVDETESALASLTRSGIFVEEEAPLASDEYIFEFTRGGPLGLAVWQTSCKVTRVGPGCIQLVNKELPQDQQIGPDSTLVGFNGERLSPAVLIQKLRSLREGEKAQLILMRDGVEGSGPVCTSFSAS